MPADPWGVTASVLVYRLLVWAYPRSFRRAYGAALVQLFRDVSRAGYRQRGWAGLCGVWSAALIDTARGALREHRYALREGGVLARLPAACQVTLAALAVA